MDATVLEAYIEEARQIIDVMHEIAQTAIPPLEEAVKNQWVLELVNHEFPIQLIYPLDDQKADKQRAIPLKKAFDIIEAFERGIRKEHILDPAATIISDLDGMTRVARFIVNYGGVMLEAAYLLVRTFGFNPVRLAREIYNAVTELSLRTAVLLGSMIISALRVDRVDAKVVKTMLSRNQAIAALYAAALPQRKRHRVRRRRKTRT